MTGQILVPLKRHDHIEEILPYVERIAHPGMRVMFLVPSPVNGLGEWWRDHYVTTENEKEALRAVRVLEEKYSAEGQRRLAEEKVSPAREALRKRGVGIAVDMYTGSVRKVVTRYARNGDVHLIMMRAGGSLRIMNFFRERVFPFRLLTRHGFSPVLLFRPDHGV